MEKDDHPRSSKKKGKGGGLVKKTFVFLLIFLIVVVVVYIIFFILNGQQQSSNRNQTQNKSASGIPVSKENINLLNEFDSQSLNDFLKKPYFTKVLPFTINLKGNRQFLKVTLYLGVSDPVILQYIDDRMPVVKDIIITTIQYKTVADFQHANGAENLKAELLRKLNRSIFSQEALDNLNESGRAIKRIYFSEFIIQ